MRAILFLFALGAFMTAEVAEAQDKKEDKKADPEPITIRRWIAAQKVFVKADETKGAFELKKYKDGKEVPFWIIRGGAKGYIEPPAGSEITNAAGDVWVVKEVIEFEGSIRIKCESKTPAKKP